MTTSDLSTLDLDKGETADIHTRVSVGHVLVAEVHAVITVLEAEDGRVTLVVEQKTDLRDSVRLTDITIA